MLCYPLSLSFYLCCRHINSHHIFSFRVVPDRPQFSVPYEIKPSVKIWKSQEDYQRSTGAMFLKSNVRGRPRNYTINHEWVSEQLPTRAQQKSANYCWG